MVLTKRSVIRNKNAHTKFVTGIYEQLCGSCTGRCGYWILLHWPFGAWPHFPWNLHTRGSQGRRLSGSNCGNILISTPLHGWLTFLHYPLPNLQLRAAIDKYNVTGTRQNHNFEYAGYSKVFNGFIDMQCIIDANAKHAAKTKALRVAWATSAR